MKIMNYKKLLKKFFVFLFLSIVLVGVIDVIQTIYTPNSFEVLERLLKRDENYTLNTTDEKKLNRENYYQITNERKQIAQTVYHEGIYVLNSKLYGIDNGKCYLLYDNSLSESGSEANVTKIDNETWYQKEERQKRYLKVMCMPLLRRIDKQQ